MTPVALYIAGPMSGVPGLNRPAFMRAERLLAEIGFEVLNPARNEGPAPEDWAGWMRLALAQLIRADGVALLPGWEASRGATLECFLACQLSIPCRPFADWMAAAVGRLPDFSPERN